MNTLIQFLFTKHQAIWRLAVAMLILTTCSIAGLPAFAKLTQPAVQTRGFLLRQSPSNTVNHRSHHANRRIVGPLSNRRYIPQHLHLVNKKPDNHLAGLPKLLTLIADGLGILGITWGSCTLLWSFMRLAGGTFDGTQRILMSVGGILGGMSTPALVEFMVWVCRAAELYS